MTGHRPKGTRYRPTPQEGWSQHVPRTAQMSLRPIRFAFRVRPDDKKGTLEIFRINTCFWGGRSNPVTPYFKHTQSHSDGGSLSTLRELAGRHGARPAADSSSFVANPTHMGQLSDNTVCSNTAPSGDISPTARLPVPRNSWAGMQSSTAKPASTSKAAKI